MKRNERQMTARTNGFDRRREQALDLAKLVIHRDAQALKGAGRLVNAFVLSTDRTLNRRGELGGVRPWTTVYQRSRNPTPSAFFTVVTNNTAEFLFRRFVDQCFCRKFRVTVHTHVDGARMTERKPRSAMSS